MFIKRSTSFERLSVRLGPEMQPVSWRKQRENTKREQKSQIRDISPSCGGDFYKLSGFKGLAKVVTLIRYGVIQFDGFPGRQVEKCIFSFESLRSILNIAVRYHVDLWFIIDQLFVRTHWLFDLRVNLFSMKTCDTNLHLSAFSYQSSYRALVS